MPGRLICVFGISGVGKTTLSQQYVAMDPMWRVLTASDLLVRHTGRSRDQLRQASRSTIEENQHVLPELIHAQRQRNPHHSYLLDAHSVINNDAELIPVPVAAIARLQPSALIFVYDDPAVIERRRTDRNRVRPQTSVSAIEAEQTLAYETCLGYSNVLAVPLRRVFAGDLRGFAEALR